jgi:signal transduction histidine kinase/ActR/RegA family two-component response regulator
MAPQPPASGSEMSDSRRVVKRLNQLILIVLLVPLVHNWVRGLYDSLTWLVAQAAVCVLVHLLIKHNRHRLAAALLSTSLLALAAGLVVSSQWGTWDVSLLIFPAMYAPVSMMLSRRAFVTFTIASLVMVALLYFGQHRLWFATPFPREMDLTRFADTIIILTISGIAAMLLTGSLRRSLEATATSELAQRQARDSLEATLGALPDLFFELDSEGLILDARAGDPTLLLLPASALKGQRAVDLLPPDAARICSEAFIEATLTGSHRGATYSILTAEGERWFELSITRRTLAEGGHRLLVLSRDVTQRVSAEQRLLQLNAGFLSLGTDCNANINQLVKLLGELVDAKWVAYGRMEHERARTTAHWGRDGASVPRVMGRSEQPERTSSIPAVAVPADAEPVQAIERVLSLSDEHSALLRVRFERPRALSAGDLRLLEIVASSISLEEQRKHVEDRLLQSQKMESVGRLAGGVAHDLNNMLTPILGYAELGLMDRRASELSREPLEQVIAAAERARELVKQLLTFSRQSSLELTTVDINELIGELRPLLRRTLREDVTLSFALGSAEATVLGDTGRMGQILLNLVINAQDAMPEGGTLIIATRMEPNRSSDRRLGHLILTVSDSGTGMNEHTLSRCFEPFYTTKDKGKGTGLGLATVYGIVQQHGGSISVQSEVGRGSTFILRFPLVEPHVALRSSGSLPAVSGHSGRVILVVEDDPVVRSLCVTILKRFDFVVHSAPDAREGLRLAAEVPIDLLLTDVILPDARAGELRTRLHELRPGVPLLYMSGYSGEVLDARGLSPTEVSFLPKPFTATALVAKVRETIAEHERASSVPELVN